MIRRLHQTAVVVFAREPKDGKVKTRLSKDLPTSTVTQLYKGFVKDVLAQARRARCDARFLYYAGTGAAIPFLRSVSRGFALKRQTGADLGARMHRAFTRAQAEGFSRIVIIGTDCLTLTARDIEAAFQKLRSHDCVIGPARDGGYYLIGLKSPQPELFNGVDFGTKIVLRQTLTKIRRSRKKVFLLGAREDIDTIVQLKNLTKSTTSAHHTRNVLTK